MVYVHLCHLLTHFCNASVPVSSGDIQKQSNGPLDLGSGMAVECLCFKIWGGDFWNETYSFRPQSQFVSMSILFLGCYGSATKRSEVLEWPDFTVYLVCPESWTKTTLTVRRGSDIWGCSMLWKRGRYCTAMYSPLSNKEKALKPAKNPLPLRPQLASSQDCLFMQPVISSKVIEGYCGSLDRGISWGLSFSCFFQTESCCPIFSDT